MHWTVSIRSRIPLLSSGRGKTMEKKLSVSIQDEVLMISCTALGVKYANTLSNVSCAKLGEVLSFESGRQFGVIRSFEWVDRRLISPRTGRPIRSSPKVEIEIELLPEFVIASTDGKDPGVVHLVRTVKLSWEMEGWRVVSAPVVQYQREEILIEASQPLGKITEVPNLEVHTVG